MVQFAQNEIPEDLPYTKDDVFNEKLMRAWYYGYRAGRAASYTENEEVSEGWYTR